MTLKHTLIVLSAGFFVLTVNAQKFDLGKVTIAELEEKEHPKDPSAAAAVLFEKGRTAINYNESEGFVMTTEVSVRIKIYKKEGYEQANKSVRYYLPSNQKETVRFDDAVTYNLVNGQIVKTKLKSDGEFDEAINRYWGSKKITMPAVKEGSVIEYSYRIKSQNFDQIRDWNFQSDIPVNYSEFKTCIPEYFIYSPNQKGFIFPKMTSASATKSIVLTNKERVTQGHVTSTQFSQDKINYSENQTTYIGQDLPAMKDESYVNNINNYMSSVSFELSMIKWPNKPIKTYSTDWESVAKTIYKYDDFGPELDKTGYFEADIDKLLAGVNASDARMVAVFNYVKANVNWNKYKGISCNDGVKKAYKEKTGNVAEINLMLTAMLRYAGFNAHPVLLSTRSNGIALFPSIAAFDYVIVAIESNGGYVLLDATEKYTLPNVLPTRDLNWFGRLIKKDGTSTSINLMPKNSSKDVVFLNYSIKPDGSAEGKIRSQYTDYEALDFRQRFLGTNKETYLELLETNHNNIEVNDYACENQLDLLKPIVESYSFKDPHATEVINEKIYISPLLFMGDGQNPFLQEKREYPIDFGYPTQNKFTVNIEIPEGYKVESLPKPMNLTTGAEIGNFKYIIANTGNKIQVMITFDMNEAIVPADYYDVLKEFYQKMIEQQKEKIVLVKA
jgi:transglutaminase-like putative cysteine protease